MNLHEYDKGLVWDENDKYIQQSWSELKQKILNTHGGLGIIAADFNELLGYNYEHNNQTRREAFSELVAEATTKEDIMILADILSIILLRPWETNLQGGWFIYYLKKVTDLEVFDAERAALVLNELYKINDYTAAVLVRTLKDYVIFGESHDLDISIYDLLRSTNILRKELINVMNPVKIFISYAKEDNELVEKLYDQLNFEGYFVWKDNHELLPGENWEVKIKSSLKDCDFVILCLSQNSVRKIGFFQEEVKTIFKLQRQRPTSKVFCIPLRLNEFDIKMMPPEFEELQYINIYEGWDDALEKVIKTILMNR